MAAARRSVRKIIKEATIDKTFKNEELISLLTHHPDKRVKNVDANNAMKISIYIITSYIIDFFLVK